MQYQTQYTAPTRIAPTASSSAAPPLRQRMSILPPSLQTNLQESGRERERAAPPPPPAPSPPPPTKPEIKYVDRFVEVPVERIVLKEIPVEVEKVCWKEVPVQVDKIVYKDREVEVEKVVEKIVHVEVPVDRIVERIVNMEVPVEKVVIKEVPVEILKVIIKEAPTMVPVEKVVTKEVQIPFQVDKIVEKIVEVPVPVEIEKIVYLDRERIVYQDRVVYQEKVIYQDRIVEVPVERPAGPPGGLVRISEENWAADAAAAAADGKGMRRAGRSFGRAINERLPRAGPSESGHRARPPPTRSSSPQPPHPTDSYFFSTGDVCCRSRAILVLRPLIKFHMG
eukprot:CAMPEP_0172205486 /NCGR_PEP_ID=MMETSP1050-20130122/32643_1 /TAXON_ID=233186 /ORGANISM="Cryptomonas curvata, Strain CCAP979/52" /LENGTH=337 /DNA_ID=CAMNT_0012884371 /DNA_START=315 /DNA_END=1326 /DNA_ORIENTATION=+